MIPRKLAVEIQLGELVIVDLGSGGWWEAHEGRDTPEEQYTNAWRLDYKHCLLLFPQASPKRRAA